MRPDTLLILHHGALGDLLCAWPALYGLAHAFAGGRRFILTRPAHLPLLTPLGFAPCPPELAHVENAFHGGAFPPAAKNCRIIRFCLDALPETVPPGAACLRALPEQELPVSQTLWEQATVLFPHLTPLDGARAAFARIFGPWKGKASTRIGLLPGSGHAAKNPPPPLLVAAARELARQGFEPVQILGPVEEERGLRLADLPALRPGDLTELIATLRGLRLILGADSGPLHLAALLGTPCLALFGPSPAGRWAPPGARVLQSPLPCAPCSASLRRLGCDKPICMEELDIHDIISVSFSLLQGRQTLQEFSLSAEEDALFMEGVYSYGTRPK